MRKHLFAVILITLTTSSVFGDATTPAPKGQSSKVIRDPKTKVIYYLESDLRHVVAISPAGKLLWCCEVIGPAAYKGSYVAGISVSDDIVVDVCFIGPGVGRGYIDKRTGVFNATCMD